MILWRVSNYQTLDGSGGLYVSGRWHTRGHLVTYCALNPATALLETLVHLEIDSEDLPERFQVLRVEGPHSLSLEKIEADSLPADWAADVASTRIIGDAWLSKNRSPLLQVPSVPVPESWNVLINPRHPDAALLKVTRIYQHPFDARLL